MEQGMNALQRSAASKGTLLTGGMLKGMDKFSQGLASTFDDKYYNRALGEYGQAYDIFNNNQGNLFNRLGTLSSIGENAAAGVGNAQIGLGNAQAQGSTNQGNIWGNAINNGGQTLNNAFQYLNQNRNQYAANATGGNPNGVNGYGVTMINPGTGG
jgi:hypothetical protein